MFDFAWTEIALIGVVALVAIGPKDLPVAIKSVAQMIKKARRMAGEFQTHVDEMVREANLDEVRSQIQDIRNFDIKGAIEKAVDSDGSIRSTLTSNPLGHDPLGMSTSTWTAPSGDSQTDVLVAEAPKHEFVLPEPEAAKEATGEAAEETPKPAEMHAEAPAWVPPEIANRPEPPAWVPPDIARSIRP